MAAGLGDVLRLATRVGIAKVRPRGDTGAAICRWAREVIERDGARDLEVRLAGRRLEVVGARERSERMLAGHPARGAHPVGKLKSDAMGFLAPGALTIADGSAWARLRSFNESVLATGAAHPYAQAFLDHVRGAFATPVADRAGVRAAMGRAMVGIVFGREIDGADIANDIDRLFGAVQSPVRRKLLAFHYAGLRERLYSLLGRTWDAAREGQPTLLALARASAPDAPRAVLLEQVPHWMFTFTGSGTDLLVRTLSMVSARPGALGRLRDECAAAGPADRAETLARLDWLNACILETGRLFPPVTRTFHRYASQGGEADRAKRAEIVHWFPLLQRDDALGATVHDFRPERWLGTGPDEAAAASNLFLRGPRACPGRDLILFVCKAALARQLIEFGVTLRSPRESRLARDPLPVSFPEREARFTAAEVQP